MPRSLRTLALLGTLLSPTLAAAATIQHRAVLSAGGSHAAGGVVSLTSNVGDVICGVSAPALTLLWSGFHAPWPIELVGVDAASPEVAPFLRRIQPDPARVSAAITFGGSRTEPASLDVFDVGGRLVRTLHRGALPAGEHSRVWDLRADAGSPVSAGLYFVRFSTPRARLAARLVVVR